MAGFNPSAAPSDAREQSLSWRGPGGERPAVALPPARQPLFKNGQLRKRWRYVGLYAEEIMLCAGVAQVGPFGQTFWAVWDRASGQLFEHTRVRPGRPEVVMDGSRVEIRAGEVNAVLRLGEVDPVEVISPSGKAWSWTRKRAALPIAGTVEAGGRRYVVDGLGVDDESAGYHARHVAWSWSAGIGIAADGRSLGWNLVEGINDSPTKSERGIWVDGTPYEPAPVTFDGLEGVRFEDGGPGLVFEDGKAERRRRDNFGLIRSAYVHRFGTFTGNLDGIELAEGAGVMEEHDVTW